MDMSHSAPQQGHQGSSHDNAHRGNGNHFDLHAAARRILAAAGFEADVTDAVRKQLETLTAPAPMASGVKDMRDRPWSSIDNDESRDLDQIEVAEQLPDGSVRMNT